jgi:hypothetical protein
MKTDLRAFQLHHQFPGVRRVKTFHGDNRHAFPLITCRCNRLSSWKVVHGTA